MLERRIKDARLGFVTSPTSGSRATPSTPSIFYTVLGDDEQRTASAAALESAKGLIRSEVGKQLGMRHTPSLEFILDALPESAAHIEDLLAKARAERRGGRRGGGRGDVRRRGRPLPSPRRDRRPTTTTARRRGRGHVDRRTHPPMAAPDGLLVVDKPSGWTSHDVVARSAGSPEPARSGTPARSTRWRPACWCSGIGRATRLLGHLALATKGYDATIRLGQTTVTDDAEGDVARGP